MMGKRENHQHKLMFLNLDLFVPKDHLLRQIDEVVDFTFIYGKVQHLYSPVGRKSIDPVILIKMLLIGYLYGIESERELEQEVTLNLAYRWFLGLDLDEDIPDHSTFSQNRKRRFNGSSVFQEIFDHIVMMCVEKGLVTGEIILTDSTHIKAYASSQNTEKVELIIEPSDYLKKLDEDLIKMKEAQEKERDAKGVKKRGKKPQAESLVKEVVINKADPDTRLLGRPNKPKGFHYLAHTSIDPSYGIITDIHATAGNLNDHEVYVERLAVQQNKFPFPIQKVGADKGYDRSMVHVGLKKLNIIGYISPVELHKDIHQDFSYDDQQDVFQCSQGKKLFFTHLRKKTELQTYYKVYSAKTKDCKACPLRESCLSKTSRAKTIVTPFGHEEMRKNEERSKTGEYKRIRRLRRIWCEGSFGCMKQKHNLLKTYKRGIQKIQEQCLFSALALNLKRMVKGIK